MKKNKLLLLDTLPNWRDMFEEYLSEKYEVQTASNIEEAKKFIQETSFDLVIVGLGSLNSLGALHEKDYSIGLEFLDFIENENISIPKIIIDNDPDNDDTLTKGKFGQDELIEAVKYHIKKHEEAATILIEHLTEEKTRHPTAKEIVEFIKNDLVDAIENAIGKPKEVLRRKGKQTQYRKNNSEETLSKNKQTPTSQNRTQTIVDFIIITTLRDEYGAVLSKFSNVHKIDQSQSVVNVSTTTKLTYRVVIVCISSENIKEMGPVKAAAKTAIWVEKWQPRYVLLVGVAGGIKDKVALGDVIVPYRIMDATVGRQYGTENIENNDTVYKRKPKWEAYDLKHILHKKSKLDNWCKYIKVSRPDKKCKEVTQLHISASILSSGDSINNQDFLDRYVEMLGWNDLHGFEMESGGVAEALIHVKSDPKLLVIRGISDFGGKNRKNEQRIWEAYALDAAASYTRAFLESGPVPPLNKNK